VYLCVFTVDYGNVTMVTLAFICIQLSKPSYKQPCLAFVAGLDNKSSTIILKIA